MLKRKWRALSGEKRFNFLYGLFFVPLGILGIVIAAFSLQWKMITDTPLILYFGYVIDHFHFVPYRDLFDMNMPGVYLIGILMGRLSGYTDFGLRVLDLSFLGVVLILTWMLLKEFGRKVSICAVILVGLTYLNGGSYWSLQREAIIMLGTAFLFWLAFARLDDRWKFLLLGLCVGCLVTIKPHAAALLPLFWLYCVAERHQRTGSWSVKEILPFFLLAVGGFLIPLLITVVYLWQIGALSSFIEIALNYWGLYTAMNGDHGVLVGWERMSYLITEFFQFGERQLWLIPAALGGYFALRFSAFRIRTILLISVTVFFAFYPVFAGQFWSYHYIPFFYMLALLTALCFVPQTKFRWLPLRAFLLATPYLFIPSDDFLWQIVYHVPHENLRAAEITHFLRENLEPEDTVQPLDWAQGALHGMLFAQAQIATPFAYDFYFYHHVSNPCIQELRHRFIADLEVTKPRFLIQLLPEVAPRPSGWDTTTEFPELQTILDTQYFVRVQGDGYLIYERLEN